MARLESIDLNLQVALGALLEERHVTRAADRLRVTQSAMSGTLKRLRAQFGDELLTRRGNVLVLTPLAESLLPLVREALSASQHLFAAGTTFEPQTSERRFSIILSDYAQACVAPDFVERVRSEAPGVRLSLQPIPDGFLQDPNGTLLQFDMAIFVTDYMAHFSVRSAELFRDHFTGVAHVDTIADPAAVSQDDLRGIPMVDIAFTSEQRVRPVIGDSASEWLSSVQASVTAGSYLAARHLLKGVRGWAMLPARLVATEFSPEEFVTFTPPFPTNDFAEAMFWHPSRDRDQSLTWLRGVIASSFAPE